MEPRVYIVILNYNNPDYTIKCLESVYNLKYDNYGVIVVDNASDDCSVDCIENWMILNNKQTVILRAEKNRGYSGGNNIGIRWALAQNDCDYVWILNNDTEVDSHSLKEMVKREQDTGAGGVGCVVCYYDERDKVQLVGNTLDLESFTLRGVGTNLSVNNIKPGMYVYTLSGPSFIMSKKLIDDVGELDETYFLYCEELELAEKARRKGYKFTYAEKSIVYHKESASARKKSTSYRDYQVIRSWRIFIGRWYPDSLTTFEEKYFVMIKKKLKHLHFKRAYAIYKGLKEGSIYCKKES